MGLIIRRFGLFASLFIACCAPDFKIRDNFNEYQKTFIEKSKYSPSQEELEKSRKINVVVLDFDFSGVSDNQEQKIPISQYATSKIESILNETGYINVLDRKIATKAKQEILLTEANGNLKYSGPIEAQYAIYGKISNLSFSSEFDARTGQNIAMNVAGMAMMGAMMSSGRGGGIYINNMGNSSIPSLYKYTAVIEGDIKVIDLKTLQEVVRIPFKQIEHSTENASTSNKAIKPAKTFDLKMVTNGLEIVLVNAKRTILNTIPIVSFVLERMDITKSKKPIFRISAGADYGIRQKWNLVCELIKERANDLTGNIDIEKEILPGYTTDVIKQNSCWIILDDKKKAQEIKIGDRCLLSPDIRKLRANQ